MSLPLEHLSASSISMFLRCPRQFQEAYIRGLKGPSISFLLIGTAVHLGLFKALKGEDIGLPFEESVAEHEHKSVDIQWKDKPETSKRIAEKMIFDYYNSVGRYLDVKETEKEI